MGRMIAEGREAGEIAKGRGGVRDADTTLDDLGVEKNLAADAVSFARTPDDIWTQFIENARTSRKYTRTTFVTTEPADPVALVVSLNVKRRNLSKGQTAVAAAEAWELARPKNGAGSSGRAKALADMFGASKTYVEQARALVERDKSGANAVKHGATSLKEAYDDLLRREGKLRGDSEELTKLRADHPDLADAVDQEALSLKGSAGPTVSLHRYSPVSTELAIFGIVHEGHKENTYPCAICYLLLARPKAGLNSASAARRSIHQAH